MRRDRGGWGGGGEGGRRLQQPASVGQQAQKIQRNTGTGITKQRIPDICKGFGVLNAKGTRYLSCVSSNPETELPFTLRSTSPTATPVSSNGEPTLMPERTMSPAGIVRGLGGMFL